MKKILLGLIIMISMNAMAQDKAYTVSKDDKEGEQLIFNGPVTFSDLNSEPTFTWLKSGSNEYKPDTPTVNFLRVHLEEYTMVVFLGTWCDDSHYMIPKFEKVLQMIDYPLSKIKMYGVDREKTTTNGEQNTYSVRLVPTIILFRAGKEVGRITETIQNSIEADLSDIIDKDQEPQSR